MGRPSVPWCPACLATRSRKSATPSGASVHWNCGPNPGPQPLQKAPPPNRTLREGGNPHLASAGGREPQLSTYFGQVASRA
eukprot:12611139-Alexandrium_andersonii.AAC.1